MINADRALLMTMAMQMKQGRGECTIEKVVDTYYKGLDNQRKEDREKERLASNSNLVSV